MANRNRRTLIVCLILLAMLVILIGYAAITGSIDMTLPRLFRGLFVEYDQDVATVYDLRFPRIIISIIAGAALAVSGVLLQAVMQNPLTDPGIIGISSAASLVATIVTFVFPKLYFSIPALSILGGLFAYFLIYSLAWDQGSSPTRLILVGIAINMVFMGIQSALKSMTGGDLTNVQSIIEGNVAQKTWTDVRVMVVYGVTALVISLFTAKSCNLLSLEDKTSKALGVNVNRDRFLVALVAIVLASVTTSVAGVISFVGLIVPHIGRIIVGSNHKRLIPFSILAGAFLLLLSDTIGRVVAYPYEIRASVILDVFGGIFFIILIKAGGKRYGN